MRVEIMENEFNTNIKTVDIVVAIGKSPKREKGDRMVDNAEVDKAKARLSALKEVPKEELNALVETVNINQEVRERVTDQEEMVNTNQEVMERVIVQEETEKVTGREVMANTSQEVTAKDAAGVVVEVEMVKVAVEATEVIMHMHQFKLKKSNTECRVLRATKQSDARI